MEIIVPVLEQQKDRTESSFNWHLRLCLVNRAGFESAEHPVLPSAQFTFQSISDHKDQFDKML